MLDGRAFVGLTPEKVEIVHRELQSLLEDMLRKSSTWPTATKEEMEDYAHLLLGSALDVGARPLAAACLRLERALCRERGRSQRVAQVVEEMRQLLKWLVSARSPSP